MSESIRCPSPIADEESYEWQIVEVIFRRCHQRPAPVIRSSGNDAGITMPSFLGKRNEFTLAALFRLNSVRSQNYVPTSVSRERSAAVLSTLANRSSFVWRILVGKTSCREIGIRRTALRLDAHWVCQLAVAEAHHRKFEFGVSSSRHALFGPRKLWAGHDLPH